MTEHDRLLDAAHRALQAGRLDEAEPILAQAAALDPHQAGTLTDLGALLRRRGRPLAAIACYRRALTVAPDQPGTWSNLGNALRDLGRFAESEAALRRAVALAPGSPLHAYNLALLLRDSRRHAEAEAILARLAAFDPANPDYAWDLGLSRLYRGAFEEGFAGYEARLRLPRMPKRDLPGPVWQRGESLAGRIVLVTSEQGFGDALQFVRFVPQLVAQAGGVVLECLPEQEALFRTIPGLAAVIVKDSPPPPYDVWVPLASLPQRLGLRPDTIPASVPYLTPPPRPPVDLPRRPGTTTIGLVWAGKPVPRDRSWAIDSLAPLFELPGLVWVSLQKGPRAADLAESGFDRLVKDAAPRLSSFADSAALIARLDLIITVDTATAHLAGALGRPVWVMLRYVSDWRWGDERPDSPWYPTMRLYRQSDPDDFAGPVAAIRAALGS
jgi:Flp pilus assembly protein TadD